MTDERLIQILQEQLAASNAEKAELIRRVSSLAEEVRSSGERSLLVQEGLRRELAACIGRMEELGARLEQAEAERSRANEQVEKLLVLVAQLKEANKNLEQQLKSQRGKRFGRTSEQAKWLNNRAEDQRAREKAAFDGKEVGDDGRDNSDGGTPGAASSGGSGAAKKATPRPKADPESKFVSDTIVHRWDEGFVMPEGARFVDRAGEPDIYEVEYIEYIPGKVVRHVFQARRIILADNETFSSTLSQENRQLIERLRPVDGCPFTASMLWFIYSEKYLYKSSINNVKHRLRDMGAVFSKSTLNRYYHMGADKLIECMYELYLEQIRNSGYLMVDETCEPVAVETGEGNEKKVKYLKRYLWAFFEKTKNLVLYVYDKGSRAREVVLKILDGFAGFLSTDGYAAYKIFDDAEAHPSVTHVGCWVHMRRNFIDALPSQRAECEEMLAMITDIFSVEYAARAGRLNDDERKRMRALSSVPVMNALISRAREMQADEALMANDLMKKAVNYLINQWEPLSNYILDGKVEISNNLVEQRMKPIKLGLKNCQVVGSEEAAKRHGFMYSLFESARLNGLPLKEYFTDLLGSLKRLLVGTNEQKMAYLPCFYGKNP